MNDIFFTSDQHWGHKNCLNFKRQDGITPMRPEFSSVEEMDETMFDNWNKTVTPGSKVYFLGDLKFGKNPNFFNRFKGLPGSKRICFGNHDDPEEIVLSEAFKKHFLWRVFKEHSFIASHIPIHPDSFRKVSYNLIGHIHEKRVLLENGKEDPRYINVCVENWNYTPIHLDEILQIIKQRS